MKRVIVLAATTALVVSALTVPAAQAEPAATSEYVVLYKEGAAGAGAQAAITAAGGTITKTNTDVGLATVTSANAGFFAAIKASPAVEGVARNRIIGKAPDTAAPKLQGPEYRKVEKEGFRGSKWFKWNKKPTEEPLQDLQWDLDQMQVDKAHKWEQGDKRVLVGVLDTGVDGSHPDIAPNFSRSLSRNFTVDLPADADGNVIDGPCAEDPDGSCQDPNDVDENDHGTHVASSIASPINKLGVTGVAPKVTIVNLRAGQDSGYFFLQPSIDALTYAGNIGVDVVNMSYYIDPWLFNCTDNPADSADEQLEQATIIKATQRALDYAHRKGVTLVAAAGNGASDYTKTIADGSSPDFASVPGQTPRDRTIPPSCISMPSEGNHVITVSSTGISTRKSYYSDHGNGYIDVAAPGGDVYDTPGGTRDVTKATLSAMPLAIAQASGLLDADGNPTDPSIVKDCRGGVCGYYQYLQGTSMASPRAAGVAALIVSKYGRNGRNGFGLSPDTVESVLKGSAVRTSCPAGGTYTYVRQVPQPDGTVRTVTTTHTCEGTTSNNGFYGKGIVNALRAVGR